MWSCLMSLLLGTEVLYVPLDRAVPEARRLYPRAIHHI